MMMKSALKLLCLLPAVLSWTPLAPGVSTFSTTTPSLEQLKIQILQLGAALDRGQSYNPTSGEYYRETMEVAKSKVLSLIEQYPNKVPKTLEEIQGEWELVFSSVPHGIFRSSPFFLAVQEAFSFAEEKSKFAASVYVSFQVDAHETTQLLFPRGFWSGQGNTFLQAS
jgi:hypothetical protein